jgi:4-hydroxy-tetrahydrodipicolinate synthase
MDRNSVGWEGQFTAMVTPFDSAGRIDEAGLRRQVDFLVESGVNVIVANGCTGEFWTQTLDERKRVVAAVQEAARGRIPIIAGCSANYTPHVVELAEHAKEIGCSGVMVMPPFLVRPNADDIFHHYKAVSDAVSIPILLYNIPRDTVNDLTPELVSRLADLETVVAIKDSSFDFNIFYRLKTMVGDRIRVLIGPSTMFGFAAVQLGADGWVDTYSNLWPQLTVELWHTSRNGQTDRAKALQRIGIDYRRLLSENDRNMYSAIKACMNMKGLAGGFPRLPLRPLGEPHLTQLREGMERLGIPHQGGSLRQAAE